MPKPRRIIRHKKNAKRKVKVIKHEQQPKSVLTEEDLKNIPPHMLDKIPAGAALKPSAQTLHRMMMQQIAPTYNPMPFYTQQQQQATNMKNDNDIKEQAVNQAKQDIINENERKRKIAQQEAANKREAAIEEHNIKMERLELDHAINNENKRRNLHIQNRELKYKGEILDKENELNQLIMKKDDLENFNRQLEHKIEMKRKQSKIDVLQHECDTVEQRNKELTNEHNALIETIDQYNSEEFQKKLKELYIKNAKLAAENMMLQQVNDQKREAFMTSMKNKAFNEINYNTSMSTLKAQLNLEQVELAKQIEANERIKRKMKRKEYLHGKVEDIWQQQQDKELEAKQLEEQEKQSKAELPTDAAVNVAKKEIENQQMQTQIDHNIELQRKIVESKVAQGQLDYLKSPQSEANMKLIADVETAIEHETNKANELKKTATLYKDARQQQILNTVKREINDMVVSGQDPSSNVWDSINTSMSTQELNVRLGVAGDEEARANQHNDNFRRMHEYIRAVCESDTLNGNTLREWLEANNVAIDQLNEAGLLENIQRFKQETGIDILSG